MGTKKLNEDEIRKRLAKLAGWELKAGKLHRTFQFTDFVTAFGWMSAVALQAEKMDHHPEWKNVYRTVEVDLTTHDAGGISEKDFELAEAMGRMAAPLLSN